MCGINGIITTESKRTGVNAILSKMNQVISHRGPDDDGFYSYQGSSIHVGMAMRRLSIIDLSSGKQPIFNDDRSLVIVFNGEIYNYKDLKQSLEEDGVIFNTASDTEVILRLYEKYGSASFSMLDGMFAFSIHDKNLEKVFIARDFFGEKPLYYTASSESFVWASELKSIIQAIPNRPNISKVGLNLYFQLTYVPAPYTIYENIHKLEANHILIFDCATFTYSTEEIVQTKRKYSFQNKNEAIQITHDLVQQSVVSRSISDVPLGTFLSGGVDSSIVSLCLAQNASSKIDTFSIGFEKKSFDETDKSRVVAKLLDSNHHEFIIGQTDLSNNLSEIILNFDEPFADSSALASYIVSKKTKEFVKVALTGDGGDEVFGGYNKYYMGRLNQRYTSLVPRGIHNFMVNPIGKMLKTKDDNRGLRFKLNRLIKAINYEGDFYYNIISLGYTVDELQALLTNELFDKDVLSYYKSKIGKKNQTLTDFRNIDLLLSLEGDMIVKVDRTSMLASLECRAPFLNKEIWNFTNQLPESYLINGLDKKHILKEAFKKYFPQKFLDKSKKGFGVPVGDWLRSDLKQELLSYTESRFLKKQSIFNYNETVNMVNNHISGKADNTFRVWTFFCFQKWYTANHGQ